MQAADRGRTAADQTPHICTLSGRVGLRAADGDYDVVAVAEIDVGPAERGDLAATERAVKQQGDDRTVDQAAALGGLRALEAEAAAGAARAEAGGEDGGALVGVEASGLAAAGRGVGSVRSPKPLERAPGERPDRHGSAGIAGGPLDGGDHHRSGRGRAAGLVKVPKVGGEARVVERSSLEPGVELAAGHGVGAAGVGRRRALEAGRCAGGGEPAVDLVDAETDDRIPRFRRDRGVQAADCGRAAADQTSHIRTPPGRVGLRAADGDYDVVAVAEIDVGPAEGGDLAAAARKTVAYRSQAWPSLSRSMRRWYAQ